MLGRDVDATFYYDLASPLAYLAAELAPRALGGAARWQPVLARDLPRHVATKPDGGSSEARSTGSSDARSTGSAAPPTDPTALRAGIERRARELGLQPLRWPNPFPFDSEAALRAATYATQIGRGIAFAQAAFRQAFAGGHALSDPDWILVAAAACEMHPRAVLTSMSRASIAGALGEATAQAAAGGVREVPCLARDARATTLLTGADALDELACLAGLTPTPAGR